MLVDAVKRWNQQQCNTGSDLMKYSWTEHLPALMLLLQVMYTGTGLVNSITSQISLPIVIWKSHIEIRALISGYIYIKPADVITHPWLKINAILAKEVLKVGHGWVVTSQRKQGINLLIHALISGNICLWKVPLRYHFMKLRVWFLRRYEHNMIFTS